MLWIQSFGTCAIVMLFTVGMTQLPLVTEYRVEDSDASMNNGNHDQSLAEGVFVTYPNGSQHQIIFPAVQYLDNSKMPNNNETKMIDLVGYWDANEKSQLVVSFILGDNVINKKEILHHSKKTIFDLGSDNKTTWIQTLSLLSQENEKPFPRIINADVYEYSFAKEKSDITILLTSEKHPTGRFGEARTWISDTIGRIAFAEITIFDVETLYRDGYLAHVLEHEMGHALGLGHASDIQSVMYPRVVIVDDSIIGDIADCEKTGLLTLSIKPESKSVVCGETV